MVCFLAEFDTNTNNDGGDQQDSDDAANHSTSYNTSRGTESKSNILINSLKIQLFKQYEKYNNFLFIINMKYLIIEQKIEISLSILVII